MVGVAEKQQVGTAGSSGDRHHRPGEPPRGEQYERAEQGDARPTASVPGPFQTPEYTTPMPGGARKNTAGTCTSRERTTGRISRMRRAPTAFCRSARPASISNHGSCPWHPLDEGDRLLPRA